MKAKKGKSLLLIVLLAFTAGGAYLYVNGGALLVSTTEKLASEAIGVSVKIGSIKLSLSDKKVSVHDLRIGNPPKFKQPHSITAQQIDVTLGSFSEKQINFKDINVKGSVVYLEVNEHGMNVLALKDMANSKEQKQKSGNQQIKVIIEHMLIDATTIHPTLTMFSGEVAAIDMPSLTLTGIGQGKSVSAGDAIVEILNAYLSLVNKQARNSGVLKHVPNMQDIQDGAGKAVKSIKNLF